MTQMMVPSELKSAVSAVTTSASAATAVPAVTTIATLIDLVARDPELAAADQTRIRSDLRRLCTLLNLPPIEVPASPKSLRRRFSNFHPEQADCSMKTLQNRLSVLRWTLKRYGTNLARPNQPLSEAWRTLKDQIPTRALSWQTSRFITWSNSERLLPDDIDVRVLERYRQWLIATSCVARPDRTFRDTLLAWNKCSVAVVNWPKRKLSIPRKREGYCRPWNDLPQSFRMDAEALLDYFAGKTGGLRRRRRPLKPESIRTHQFRVRQAASILLNRGIVPTSLKDIVNPDHAEIVLQFFLDRNAGKASSQSSGMLALFLAVARHWLKPRDEALIDELTTMSTLAFHRQKGMTAKNRRLLQQFETRRNMGLLLGFPRILLAEAGRSKESDAEKALLVQTAIIVEILIMTSMRRKDLHELRVDEDFNFVLDYTGRRAFLNVVASKNDATIFQPLPNESSRLLQAYIEKYRPLLGAPPSPYLFPSEKPDTPKSKEQLVRQMKKALFDRTGLVVTAHLFRHLACLIALSDGECNFEMLRQHLRHKRNETTANSYIDLQNAAASRRVDDMIVRLRDELCGVPNG